VRPHLFTHRTHEYKQYYARYTCQKNYIQLWVQVPLTYVTGTTDRIITRTKFNTRSQDPREDNIQPHKLQWHQWSANESDPLTPSTGRHQNRGRWPLEHFGPPSLHPLQVFCSTILCAFYALCIYFMSYVFMFYVLCFLYTLYIQGVPGGMDKISGECSLC
jgi:hypothetical protein